MRLNINDPILFKLPPFFEFQSEEITTTGIEFYKAGVLKPPYPNVEFETEYMLNEPSLGVRELPVRMWVSVRVVADKLDMVIRVCAPDKTREEAGMMPYMFTFDADGISMKTIARTEKVDKREKDGICDWAYGLICTLLMVINMKHFDRKVVEISTKLNKARARNKKPLLRDHIAITMKPNFKRAYLEQGNGHMKPHWRRGHLRTLGCGRRVGVQPCMVNWNGEVIEPKTYTVAHGRSA